MILVVGGEGSGKLDYVKSLGYSEAEIAVAALDERNVVYHTEQMVFADYEKANALLQPLLAKEVVFCSEVGSGIIPTDRAQRLGREAVGRLCCQLAREATAVVRLVCGIPTAIKGELP